MHRHLSALLVGSGLLLLSGCADPDVPPPPQNGTFVPQEDASPPPDGVRPPDAADEVTTDPVRATKTNGVQEARILVERDGVEPEAIKLTPGVHAVLTFVRHDPEACREQIHLPALNLETPLLALGEDVTIEFVPRRAGVYMFHCGVERLRGRLIVQR